MTFLKLYLGFQQLYILLGKKWHLAPILLIHWNQRQWISKLLLCIVYIAALYCHPSAKDIIPPAPWLLDKGSAKPCLYKQLLPFEATDLWVVHAATLLPQHNKQNWEVPQGSENKVRTQLFRNKGIAAALNRTVNKYSHCHVNKSTCNKC